MVTADAKVAVVPTKGTATLIPETKKRDKRSAGDGAPFIPFLG